MLNRIVRLYEIGGPGALTLEPVTPEPPRPGEALLKVEAIGLKLNYRCAEPRAWSI